MSGTIVERAWKHFFLGSHLFEDVCPGIEGSARIGQEEGVDLFLPPVWRESFPSGMIQVKSSAAHALEFLEYGLEEHHEIIPVVIGMPPLDKTPEQVLRRLAIDYCWHPHWKEVGEFAEQLDEFLLQLCLYPEGALLRTHRPKWALDLA